MRFESYARVMGTVVVALSASIAGCGPEEIKLKDAPPAQIAPVKTDAPSKSQDSLKSGAPSPGSSSGIKHNPSETPR